MVERGKVFTSLPSLKSSENGSIRIGSAVINYIPGHVKKITQLVPRPGLN